MTQKIKSKRKSHKQTKNYNYIVAIPSYKRYEEITKKTLPTLKKGKINNKRL